MICKRICTEYASFQEESEQDLYNLIRESCVKNPKGPAQDYKLIDGKYKTKRRDMRDIVRDMMTTLAICNNVTPVQSEPIHELENIIDDRGHMRPSVVDIHPDIQVKRNSFIREKELKSPSRKDFHNIESQADISMNK